MSLQFLVIAGPDKGKSFPIVTGRDMMLGRGIHAYYQLNDPDVSRNHCQILLEGEKAAVICNGGLGGTLVNGKKVERHLLKPGDVLQVGHSKLRLYAGQPPEEEEDSDAPVPLAGQQPAAPPRIEPLTDLAGHTLGHYHLESVIGTGHTGVVFLATDKKDKHSVAFKVFHDEAIQDDEDLHRFIRAAKTVLPLRHPNLVTLYSAGKNAPYCWMAMEYIAGENMQQVIDRISGTGALEWKYAFRVALHIARALEFAHGHHIVHRNVTPTNILRDGTTKVAKLSDLILAKALAGPSEEDVTSPGALVGDLAYLPPERIRGMSNLDARSDLYGLGTMVYALLTGRPPFTGATLLEKITRIRQAAPEKPTRFQSAIPAKLESIVLKLLAKQQDARYQTATELVGELERLALSTGVMPE
jgi:serine/threonine protein kinase